MKMGKTLIQIYAVWGMFKSVLLILLGLGIGMFSGLIDPSLTTIGELGGIFFVLGAVAFYIDYNLFNFKEWARLVVTALVGLGIVTSLISMTIGVFFLIDVFVLYLMWMDKDTMKAFKK